MSESIAVIAKSMPRTIVDTKRSFSKPRRVWNAELMSPPPPSAPPFAAPDCWRRIAAMRRTEMVICAYGRMPEMLMGHRLSWGGGLGKKVLIIGLYGSYPQLIDMSCMDGIIKYRLVIPNLNLAHYHEL